MGPDALPTRKRIATVLWAVLCLFLAWFLFRAVRGVPDDVNAFRGDFKHFYWAAQAMSRGENIYESGTHGYIYPPLLAAGLSWMGSLPVRTAQLLWIPVNLAITIWCLTITAREVRTRLKLRSDTLTTVVLWTTGVALTVDPIRFEFQEGQSDTIVLWGLLCCLAFMDSKPWRAGAAIGLAANIKYQALVVLPYLLIRRRFRAAGAVALWSVLWALAPALVCGWSRNLSYLSTAFRGVLKLFGTTSEGPSVQTHDLRWLMSISIPSALARMMGEQAPGALIAAGALAVAIAFTLLVWWMFRKQDVGLWNRSPSDPADAGVILLEWCGLIVMLLAFSPQAMVRHGFLLIPVHMTVGAVLLAGRAGVQTRALWVGMLMFQFGSRLPPGDWEASRNALDWWRSIGGTSWCMLAMGAALIWCGLQEVRAMLGRAPFRDSARDDAPRGIWTGPT